jgi:formylglycine-generating enzyme required for sulfatase activity
VTRNAGARWWLPSEDEWYKAAYHKNDGVTGNYWDYPTRTNSLPNNNKPSSDTGNSANYYNNGYTTGSSAIPFTDAGAYALSGSPYGTFDQGGSVWEWNDRLFNGPSRGIRGGSWSMLNSPTDLRALIWHGDSTIVGSDRKGFRVASAFVPEPSTSSLAASIFALLACRRRRRD